MGILPCFLVTSSSGQSISGEGRGVMRGSLDVLFGSLLGVREIPFPYLPLYSLPYHDFTLLMADKTPNDAASFTNAAPGTVQSILREVCLAQLVASMGGSYLLEGKVSFSPSSSPIVHYSNRRIVVVSDPSNDDTVFKNLLSETAQPVPLVEGITKRQRPLLPR
ncbi:hypothetical protein LIER_06762 [Lithospermum erythrorhizon]|uniref:Uncharacterized protein n=1 Tax=Lithospermum erythrorhizon TaxID=34254 RepID=A0AAV3P5Q2_LITER